MGFDITKKIAFAMSLSGDDKVNSGIKSVTGGMLDAEKASGLLVKGFTAIVGVAGIASFAGMVKGFIDGAAAMHDMSIQTGLSVVALQQFKSIGSYTETSIDAVATASLKLSKNLAATGDESKGVGKAITALGLDFDKFKKLNPDEQMLEVAKAMAQFEDGSGKSAAAMMMFGKEGAKLLPFLADLADSSDQVTAKLSDQEKALAATRAAMADAFGDNLTAVRKASEGWKKDLVMGLMPALYEFSEIAKELFGGTSALGKAIKGLANDGSLAEWARYAAIGVSVVVDVLEGAVRILGTLLEVGRGVFGALLEMGTGFAKGLYLSLTGDFTGAWEAMKTGFTNLKAVGIDTAKAIGDTWGAPYLGATFRDRLVDLRAFPPEAKKAKDSLDLSEPIAKTTAAAKAQKDEYEALKNKIADLILKQEAEIEQGGKLSESDKLLVQAKRQLEGAELATVTAMIEVAKAREAQIAQDQRAQKATEEAVKAREAALKALDGEAVKLQEQIDAQLAANETMRTGVDRTRELEIARLRDAAASAERKALIALERNEDEAQYEAFKTNAAKLRELADAKEAGIGAAAAKQARDEWTKVSDQISQGLTDSLYRAFESGKDFFSTLWAGIKNTFKTTTLRLIVDTVMSWGGALVSSGLQSLGIMPAVAGQAGAAANGISGALGMGNWLNSLTTGAGNMVNTVAGWAGLSTFGGVGIGSSVVGGATLTPAAMEAMLGAEGYGASAAAMAANEGLGLASIGTEAAASGAGLLGSLGTVAPYLAAAGLIASAFKHKPTHHEGSVVFADAGGARTDASRDFLGVLQHQNSGTDSALRTMLGGAVGTLNMLNMAFGGSGGFAAHGQFAADNDDASFGILDILRNGARIGGIEKTQGGNRKDYASDPTQGFAEFGADVGRAVRSAIDTIDLPQWARDALSALGGDPGIDKLTEAARQIAATQQALTGLFSTLDPLGGIFSRIAAMSDEAKMGLAGMVGGIDQLVAKSRSFVENYYTQDEQASIAARSILEMAQKAGVSSATFELIQGLSSKTQLRGYLEGQDLSTDFGKQMAALGLNIAQPFAGISEYLEKNHLTLGALAGRSITPIMAQLLASSSAAAAVGGDVTDTAATADDAATTADATTSTAENTAATAEAVAESASILREIVDKLMAGNAANADGLLALKAELESIKADVADIRSLVTDAATAPQEA